MEGLRRPGVLPRLSLLLVAVGALLAIAPASWIAASMMLTPPATVEEPAPGPAQGPGLKTLPLGVRDLAAEPTVSDIDALARRSLGAAEAREFMAMVVSAEDIADDGQAPAYPHRYVGLGPLLDRASQSLVSPAAVELGATLMLLARQTTTELGQKKYPNAARAAYAVLDHARSGGDCTAQLNLLLLVAADDDAVDSEVRLEAERAVQNCPGDPTPEWLMGQYFSQNDEYPSVTTTDEATNAFTNMQKKFRGSPLPFIGLADTALRKGLRTAGTAPFTARSELRRAERNYREAARLRPPQVGDRPAL